jgi:hypothetical protein
MSRPYPIVEFAQKIGKNTAELTVNDLGKFMQWWMKQAPRKDLLKVTPEQRTRYNKDVAAMNKFRAAQTSRLPVNLNDQELIDDGMAVEMQLRVDEEGKCEEIVCSMELTALDVKALLFAIERVCADYEMAGHEFEASFQSLQEGLEGV